MSAAMDRVEAAIQSRSLNYKHTRLGITSQCANPAHPDNTPSLDIKHNGRDRVLMLCRVCGEEATPDIVSALGLRMADLYDEANEGRRQWPPRQQPRQQPKARPVMPKQQRPQAKPQLVAEYPYVNEQGTLLMTQRRFEPGWNGKRKSFSTVDASGKKGVDGIRRVPYHLPEIMAEAEAGGIVAIVEGEKNVESIRAAGGRATCNLGGSSGEWTDEFSHFLIGCSEAAVIADKDEPGRKHAAKIMASLRRVGIPARAVEAAVGNDVTDHLDAGYTFADLVSVDLGAYEGGAEADESGRSVTTERDSGISGTWIDAPARQGVVSASNHASGNSGISGTPKSAAEWEDPVPIERVPLPPFPAERLGTLGKYVIAAAECLQVPVDFTAFSTLATISTATGGRRKVFVKHRWQEITALWMAGFAESSARKTPALNAGADPLRDIETELIEDSRGDVEAGAQEIRILTAQMAKAEQLAADLTRSKGDTRPSKSSGTTEQRVTPEQAKAEAEAARMRLVELGEGPQLPRLLVRDATLEVIGKIMYEQGGRIGSLASEGGLFKIAAGLYSKGGVANTDLLLEAYTGGPYSIDRITRSGGRMAHTFLSLGLIVQPGIVAGVEKKNPEFRENGLLGRFLYCMPPDVEEDTFDSPDIPEDLEVDYANRIKAIVTTVWASPQVAEIRLAEDAREVFAAFYDEFGRRRKPGGDLHSIADWAGKYRGNLIRLAACISLYEDPTCLVITKEVIENCIAMTPYFVEHAKAVFDLMGEDPESNVKPMRDVLAWLRSRPDPLAEATVRDVWQGVKGRKWATEAEKVHAVIGDLSDLGWIEPINPSEEQQGRRGRKPSPKFAVHPWVAIKPTRTR